MDLAIIRHGQSIGNVEKRLQGRSDYALTDLGRQQAQRLGQHLAKEDWTPTRIYTSPLVRAAETATIARHSFEAAAAIALPEPQPDPNLQENDCGIFTGLTWAESRSRHGELCAQLEASPDWLPIPGGETPTEGRDRARTFLQRLFAETDNGDRVWVFTHSWLMKHLISELLGCDRSWKLPTANTGRYEFRLDRDRWHRALKANNPHHQHNRYNTDLWQIRRLNDIAHLQGLPERP
ncbi:MAG: histidine phosphatase family protein [Cyanophyceae cyanobacterium]